MEEKFKLKCSVNLILTKIENGKEYVLLQKRCNTKILDGKYDVSCGGHLEKGETLTEAMIRETKEEIGVEIKPKDLNYNSMIHANFDGDEYFLVSFHTNQFEGNPQIMEPDLCNELKWFDIHHLPDEIADNRKMMIEDYLNHNLYREIGFHEIEKM